MHKNITVRIITIGDELLIGQTIDTNSAWIGEVLTEEGFEVVGKETVSDSYEAITMSLERAIELADVILITGGLGPTKDDITTKTLADYFNSTLVFNPTLR